MIERGRTISQTNDLAQHAQQVRTQFDRSRAELAIAAGAENGSNVRAFTVQVVDRLKNQWPGRWRFWIFLAATQGGAPSATGNTFSLTTGTELQEVIADAVYHLLTDSAGQAAFTLELPAGAGTRYVYADIDGQTKEFGPFAWT